MKKKALKKRILILYICFGMVVTLCANVCNAFAGEELEIPCAHNGSIHRENEREASCDTENGYGGQGYTGDIVCDLCGGILEEGEYTSALAHDFSSESMVKDKEEDDYYHYFVNRCSRCGKESYVTERINGTVTTRKEEHAYQITGHREPTETEAGYTENTCSVCGHVYMETIPPVGSYIDNFRSEGGQNSITFVLGYSWWTETEVLATYSRSQMIAMAGEDTLTYSYRDSIYSAGYARVKGIYFENLIRTISETTGRFDMEDVEGFRFSASDNYKAGTYYESGLIFDPDRYFYPNLSLYADGMGGFTDPAAAEEESEQVPAMLAVYEGRIRGEAGKGCAENLAAHMGTLTDGKAYRLMFGQKSIEDQTAGNSIATIQGITIIVNSVPSLDVKDSKGASISEEGLSLVIDDENIVHVEVAGVGEKAEERFLQNVKWTTTDDRIVSVDANGRLTAKGEGTVTITASSKVGEETITRSITITVGKDGEDDKGKGSGDGKGDGTGDGDGDGKGKGNGDGDGSDDGKGNDREDEKHDGKEKAPDAPDEKKQGDFDDITEDSEKNTGDEKKENDSSNKEQEKPITLQAVEITATDIELSKALEDNEEPVIKEDMDHSISLMKISASGGGSKGGAESSNYKIKIENDHMWIFSLSFALFFLGAGGVLMWIKYKKEF